MKKKYIRILCVALFILLAVSIAFNLLESRKITQLEGQRDECERLINDYKQDIERLTMENQSCTKKLKQCKADYDHIYSLYVDETLKAQNLEAKIMTGW